MKKKKPYTSKRIVLNIVISLILLLAWFGSTITIVKILVILYFLFRLWKAIMNKFRCMTCLKKLAMATGILLLLAGFLPSIFYPALIVVVWIEPYL